MPLAVSSDTDAQDIFPPIQSAGTARDPSLRPNCILDTPCLASPTSLFRWQRTWGTF